MRIIVSLTRPLVLALLVLTSSLALTQPQDIEVLDPGPNAAIRFCKPPQQSTYQHHVPSRYATVDGNLRGWQSAYDVLSEPLVATNGAATVATLRNQGVSVFTYPLTIQLISPRQTDGDAFEFTLTGPPGRYSILNSTDLVNWRGSGALTNVLGTADFPDSGVSRQKFFRATSTP